MKIRRNLLMPLAATLVMTGCASIGPPMPPSLELPKPPTDLHAARKGNRVTLTWNVPARTTDHQKLRYLGQTNVCRNLETTLKVCGKPVGETPPPADFIAAEKGGKKIAATFSDTLSAAIQQEHPAGSATYAVEVLNAAARGAGISNQVHVPLVPTLPPFGDFAARTVAQGVMLSWDCPATSKTKAGISYLFRIFRRLDSSSNETRIAELDASGCAEEPSAGHAKTDSFLDQTLEWEKTYSYRGTVVSVVDAGKSRTEVEGDDTPAAKVFAHDIFPPAVPTGVQAVYSGPGQQPFIDVIWAPVSDADLDGYNVYRHQTGEAPVKLNPELIKTPAFRDTRVETGKTYLYSVSAVDQRGNESARSEEGSETVPQTSH
jgi:hypothetical protein